LTALVEIASIPVRCTVYCGKQDGNWHIGIFPPGKLIYSTHHQSYDTADNAIRVTGAVFRTKMQEWARKITGTLPQQRSTT
jgi:hypothetical protein